MLNTVGKQKTEQGFSLIEAMVSFAVLAFGLLAVVSFQSQLVSGSSYNKARAEAIGLAQQKLDQIRSYTNEAELVANLEGVADVTSTDTFPASIADNDYPQDAGALAPEGIDGINAQFSRQWSVAVSGDEAEVIVSVSWTDPQQGLQQVDLNTTVSWRNPRGVADLEELDNPLVPSATGRAYLGEGHVDDTSTGTARKDNGDGTVQGDFDNDDDLELVDEATGDVVLTLRDACVRVGSETTCTDFVRIAGYVAIDTTDSNMALSDVYVLASDAAYCARDLSNTLLTGSSPNGHYDYYFYTCYLGGGWHGNIGLLFNGGTANDAACVGDPTASTTDGEDKWRRYELAKRRVYRGMVYELDESNNPVKDADDNILWYSRGIADATTLPDSDWEARAYWHSFVVTKITGAGSGGGTATDCLPALTRQDAVDNNYFYGNANDFVCLNSDEVAGDDNFEYLDDYSETLGTEHWALDDCPYDPSDPPSWRYTISGTVNTSYTPADGTLSIITSDGTENCTWTTVGTSTTYSCDIYAWEDNQGNISGWTGAVKVTAPVDMACAKSPVNLETVYENPVFELYTTGIASNVSDENYTCVTLASPTISGTITAIGNDLTGSTVIATEDGTGEQTECTIVLSTTLAANDTLTYTCDVVEPSVGAGWVGTITFTPPEDLSDSCSGGYTWSINTSDEVVSHDAIACTPDYVRTISGEIAAEGDGADLTGISVSASPEAACTTEVSSVTSAKYVCEVTEHGSGWTGSVYITPPDGLTCTPTSIAQTELKTDVTLDGVVCEVPILGSWVTIAGKLTVSNGASLDNISVTTEDSLCTLDADGAYSCSVWEDGTGAGWSGSVTVSSSNADVTCTPSTHTVTGITANHNVTDVTDCNLDLSGVVVVTGNIWVYDTARASVTGITMTDGTCTFASSGGDFTCTSNTVAGDATWSGSVTISSDKSVCGTNPLTFSGIAPRTTLSGYSVIIQKNDVSCP